LIGTQIRHYRLEEELGRGPHGVVYRASDGAGDVAVKVVHPMLATDPGFVEALRREHAKVAAVGSAGCVRVRELLDEGGHLALVSDLAEGRPLSDRHGPQDVGEVVAILRAALEALGECHARGLVHANLKPSNVWYAGGKVRLTDAGLSRAADQVPGARQLGGELDYTAPEAFQGRREAPGDVYALGQIAWMLLVGRPACPAGPEPMKMAWHLTSGACDVLEERPDVPVWLADLVGRMVALDAVQRPRDALKAAELLEALAGRPEDRLAATTFDPATDREVSAALETVRSWERPKWRPERNTWTDLAPERDPAGPHTPTMEEPAPASASPVTPAAAMPATPAAPAASSAWLWGVGAMLLLLAVIALAVALT
jgi:serine/threonine protein kinase